MKEPREIDRVARRMLTEHQILCNVCGIPLITIAESKIGVHIACVQEVNNRPSRRIPRPGYGTRRKPNAPET